MTLQKCNGPPWCVPGSIKQSTARNTLPQQAIDKKKKRTNHRRRHQGQCTSIDSHFFFCFSKTMHSCARGQHELLIPRREKKTNARSFFVFKDLNYFFFLHFCDQRQFGCHNRVPIVPTNNLIVRACACVCVFPAVVHASKRSRTAHGRFAENFPFSHCARSSLVGGATYFFFWGKKIYCIFFFHIFGSFCLALLVIRGGAHTASPEQSFVIQAISSAHF